MRAMLILFFVWFGLSVSESQAQNYIVNGSFERPPKKTTAPPLKLAPCAFSGNPAIFDENLDGWQAFYTQTPDLFWLPPGETLCPLSLPAPRSGERMVGLIMYLPDTEDEHEYGYHEFATGALVKPLTPGKRYRLAFWTHSDLEIGAQHLQSLSSHGMTRTRPLLCGNFGFFFSTQPFLRREDFFRSIFDFNIRPQFNHAEVVDTRGEWQRIHFDFEAPEAWRHFVFGNFFSDNATPTNVPDDEMQRIYQYNAERPKETVPIKRIAYYFFDDFTLMEMDDALEFDRQVAAQTLRKALEKREAYELPDDLLFDVGSATLKPQALPLLDSLAAVLTHTLTDMRLLVEGHTDNQGGREYNLKLSLERAEAVKNRLILKGVAPERLRAEGLGFDRPAADNLTPEGRARNRRVCLRQD